MLRTVIGISTRAAHNRNRHRRLRNSKITLDLSKRVVRAHIGSFFQFISERICACSSIRLGARYRKVDAFIRSKAVATHRHRRGGKSRTIVHLTCVCRRQCHITLFNRKIALGYIHFVIHVRSITCRNRFRIRASILYIRIRTVILDDAQVIRIDKARNLAGKLRIRITIKLLSSIHLNGNGGLCHGQSSEIFYNLVVSLLGSCIPLNVVCILRRTDHLLATRRHHRRRFTIDKNCCYTSCERISIISL